MEDLMYYVWQQRIFTKLSVAEGQEVEILDPGLRNFESGPDFFNAKLRVGGTLWVGNVEMHVRATDWYRHHHDRDQAYHSVLLHVVMQDDGKVTRPDGQQVLQATLPMPETLVYKYRQLTTAGANCFSAVTCGERLHNVPRLIVTDWKVALAYDRMNEKAGRVRDIVEKNHQSWQDAFFVLLCRAFGTGVNGDAFERLARSLPYKYLLRHIDHPRQVAALLLGQAGFLTAVNPAGDARHEALRSEYDFLRSKFSLTPLPVTVWKLGGVRPQAAPQTRLVALAALLCAHPYLFSDILEAKTLDGVLELLRVPPTPSADKSASATSALALGRTTLHSLVINAVVPLLLAYAKWCNNEEVEQRAMALLEAIPAEKNRYVDFCRCAGFTAANAYDTQALLQLYHKYCEPHRCIRCRIGYWLMRHG